MNDITKIVLTGGPCAGKTTALVRIIEHFTGLGYQVYTLPEVATMFYQAGVDFMTSNKALYYEIEKSLICQLMQMEDNFVQMAKNCNKPAIIISDRGTMDVSAYLSTEMWHALLNDIGTNVVKLRDARYDAVIHMVTAANGAAEFYTTENNDSRTETVDQACELDKRLIAAWTGHPHLRVVDNNVDFEKKIHNVLSEISNVIGIPKPIEAEKKYVVEVVGEIPHCAECEITQIYLNAEPGTENRLRKRGKNGTYVYVQSTKKQISESECIETERRLTPRLYVQMLQQADPERIPIIKNRKNFVWDKQYFELDTFIEPKIGLHLLEVEGNGGNGEIHFPPFLKVVEDVTGNTKYYNSTIALKK